MSGKKFNAVKSHENRHYGRNAQLYAAKFVKFWTGELLKSKKNTIFVRNYRE